MLGTRSALLIAGGTFDDPELSGLRSPARDVEELAPVLRDPTVGDFAVEVVRDGTHSDVTRAIEKFFDGRQGDDVLLLHVSTHGIKDSYGELSFATRDSARDLLGSTSVSARFLQLQMERCRARTIILLLDCCYSGTFLAGMKGDDSINLSGELGGHGRVVLTATNRAEYAWEGDAPNELDVAPSHFTGAIVQGLKTGDADQNRDGAVDVYELYEYVCGQVRESNPRQTPQLWSKIEHRVVVARSRHAALPSTGDTVEESAVTFEPVAPDAMHDLVPLPPSPTRDSAVRSLKFVLADPARRIQTFEVIDATVTSVIESASRPDLHSVTHGTLLEELRRYREESDTLLHLLATGVFHDLGDHIELWIRVVKRLSRLRTSFGGAYLSDLEPARLYPALMATWTMGVASILAGREQFLVPILLETRMREVFGTQRMLSPVSYLNPGLVIDGPSLVRGYAGPSGAQWLFPQSHFLQEELRAPFEALEPDDSSYEEACDRLELLASMLAVDTGNSYVWKVIQNSVDHEVRAGVILGQAGS